MDHNDIRTLKLLEEIEENHVQSQRELAKKLDISLGLVNSFIKRLAHKGFFKITTIPKNRVKYILTPEGAVEKTRLTYKYIQHSYRFYKDARYKLRKLFQKLEAEGVSLIVFYGASDLAEIAYISLQETSIEMVAVVDMLNAGKQFLGYSVLDPVFLSSLSFDRILITAIDSREQIIDGIIENGASAIKIVTIE
ncbi:MAG: winged helix-turn-helix transcriptional regulator [Proteobacteria bacterium]|nr:winged helix-turn-helix transcriptional regulator [Desulfobacteraceae bacterium]MBU3981656.1 winged helix-turn-helix transcriptional regulator [Pseudomonadota bacterium]MBU4013823.1 winged helix-turn-helix transcriptional regulator [Pseudomonadota bacterium]MBU4068849.1 winged helix-turn-helix transcriptional regulator [Pseudomonadota bacterium]MBU4101827.1 winged helix-turn-helix transcriptional regulator [Pseudomonadota bacterium]